MVEMKTLKQVLEEWTAVTCLESPDPLTRKLGDETTPIHHQFLPPVAPAAEATPNIPKRKSILMKSSEKKPKKGFFFLSLIYT